MDKQEPVAGQATTSTIPPSKKKMGRPTIYSAELAATLCNYLSRGMSLRTACKQPGMPNVSTVFLWFSESNKELWRQDFIDQYTRAKQEAADAMAEDILDIADAPLLKDDDAKLVNAAIQRNRLRIDTRKFLMAKMKPKVYGDKFDVTSDGEKIEIGRGMGIEEITAILERAEKERNEAGNDEKTPQDA